MKHTKWLALLLAGAMVFSVASLAGCNDRQDDTNQNTDNNNDDTKDPSGPSTPTPTGSATSGVICYDNLPDDGISLSKADTTFATAKGLDTSKFTPSDYTKIATYDAETGVFTAVGAGTITYTDGDGVMGKLTVAPAYVEDPENQYSGSLPTDTSETQSTLLGHTHDPSFLEVVNSKTGASTYYLFSTGWVDTTSSDGTKTYGNAIHSSKDLITWEYEGRTFDWETRKEDFLDTKAGKWLYDGITSGYGESDASWWAPDIVPCPTGGYWLYTCVVDGSEDNGERQEGMQIGNYKYARACILLYYSKSVMPGTFKPVKDSSGDPVVLMQSSIKRGESETYALNPSTGNDLMDNTYYRPLIESAAPIFFSNQIFAAYVQGAAEPMGFPGDMLCKTEDRFTSNAADIRAAWDRSANEFIFLTLRASALGPTPSAAAPRFGVLIGGCSKVQ